MVKNSPANAGDETQVQSLRQKFLLSRKWQPTLVLLPEKYHEQRSLAGYVQSMGSQKMGHDSATKQ